MIAALKALFEPAPSETAESKEHRMHLAAAALLIETARADFTQSEVEENALEGLLARSLNITAQEVKVLKEAAEQGADEATSLYQFTSIINDFYSMEQKLELIQAMWTVAYADGDIDKYEEHLIRQVADLTYVAHQDYIRCKLAAQKA